MRISDSSTPQKNPVKKVVLVVMRKEYEVHILTNSLMPKLMTRATRRMDKATTITKGKDVV
jgi:hypothetical protein